MDATYRSELKALNELNFARFDAKLEQRVATLEARLGARIDAKLDAAVAQHAFAQLEAKIERGFAELRTTLEQGLKEQTRWMFLAWSTLLVPTIGLVVAVIGLWLRS